MTGAVSRDDIEAALKSHNADYVEIRLDDTASNRIVYRGRELEEIGRTRSFGGNVRALVNGGWGFVSFNDPGGLKERVAEAVTQARHVGNENERPRARRADRRHRPAVPGQGPARGPAGPQERAARRLQRHDAVRRGRDQHEHRLRRRPQAASSSPATEGSYIEQERIDVVSRLAATARKNGDMQQSSMSLGALNDFSYIETLGDTAKQIAEARRRAAERAVREGGAVPRGPRPDPGRRLLPRGVRPPLGVRLRLRERPHEGDHGARPQVRPAAPEHRRRRGRARPARQLQVRRRGRAGHARPT